MPAPEILAFGDGDHEVGATGLTIDGGGFGAFPGSAWIYENADRSGDADELTVGAWNDIELTGVEIPGSPNNAAGTRYLFVQREDLAWSQGFSFTLADGVVTEAPVLLSAVFNDDGTALIMTFDQVVTIGAGGDGGFVLDASGGAATLTYVGGDGTAVLEYSTSRAIDPGETVTLDYTQPGDGVENVAGDDLESFADFAAGHYQPAVLQARRWHTQIPLGMLR